MAAEIVAAFVSNNPVPRSELSALFETVHAAVKRLAEGGAVASRKTELPAPAVSIRKSVSPDYLICLDDGLQVQIVAAAPVDPRHDAGSVSREMEPARRLSDGRVQLRGAAIRVGEEDRVWAFAQEGCSRPALAPAGERQQTQGRSPAYVARSLQGHMTRVVERRQAAAPGETVLELRFFRTRRTPRCAPTSVATT